MNVKFKMPKFGRKLTGGMGKELLMTILGTTISIVLTFGTAHIVQQHQAEQVQRQTAMMLIHDINASVAIVEYLAESEEKQKSAFQYVIDHLDQIDSLPMDTLYKAVSMLGSTFTDGQYFDDFKEQVFNSSQDTWKSLDDVAFVDNMERFYKSRRYLETMMTHSPEWKYPMSQEEYYDWVVQFNSNDQSLEKSCAVVLKEKLRDPKIKFYIDFLHLEREPLVNMRNHGNASVTGTSSS